MHAPRAPKPTRRAKRSRRIAWAGLIAICWAVTLGPIVHALWHDRPHRHLADGSIEMLDPALAESLPHVHADGTVHGRMPLPDREPTDRHSVHGDGGPEPQPGDRNPGGRHGGSSLAHFGVALVGAPPPVLPLRPVATCELRGLELVTTFVAPRPATSIQPRAPPSV